MPSTTTALGAWTAEHAGILRDAEPEMGSYVAPDALIAVGAHVQREYGITGYRVSVILGNGWGVFEVQHADGSRFRLCADRWGNVERVPEH